MKRDLVELNRKIRHSRKKHNNVIRRRNNLKRAIDEMLESHPKIEETHTPEFRQLEQAFDRAYRSYRVMGRPRMDPEESYRLVRSSLIDLITRELSGLRSVRIQTTTWIRFRRDDFLTPDSESVELAFMTDFFKGSEIDRLSDIMINHMREQIESPALMNRRFIFDQVLRLVGSIFPNFAEGNQKV